MKQKVVRVQNRTCQKPEVEICCQGQCLPMTAMFSLLLPFPPLCSVTWGMAQSCERSNCMAPWPPIHTAAPSSVVNGSFSLHLGSWSSSVSYLYLSRVQSPFSVKHHAFPSHSPTEIYHRKPYVQSLNKCVGFIPELFNLHIF